MSQVDEDADAQFSETCYLRMHSICECMRLLVVTQILKFCIHIICVWLRVFFFFCVRGCFLTKYAYTHTSTCLCKPTRRSEYLGSVDLDVTGVSKESRQNETWYKLKFDKKLRENSKSFEVFS